MTAPTAAEIAREAMERIRYYFDQRAIVVGSTNSRRLDDCRTVLAALAAAEADRASAVEAFAVVDADGWMSRVWYDEVSAQDDAKHMDINGEGTAPFRVVRLVPARGTVRLTDSERKEG